MLLTALPPLRRAPLLAAVPGLAHGFSTREGGVSRGGLGPLNLARRAGETDEALAENWRRAVLALDPALRADDVALLEQVHGADVLLLEHARGPLAATGRADGAVTTRPGLVLTVRTADCVPVLLAALLDDGRAAGVGVAHAGWRGVALDVVAATVAALCRATGRPPGALLAAIGPHIGPAAFEVGDEVVAALEAAGLPRERVVVAGHPPPHVDLEAAVRLQLARAGVPRVARVAGCTWSDPDLHSHRRDPQGSGRLAGLVALTRHT